MSTDNLQTQARQAMFLLSELTSEDARGEGRGIDWSEVLSIALPLIKAAAEKAISSGKKDALINKLADQMSIWGDEDNGSPLNAFGVALGTILRTITGTSKED